MKLPKPRKRGDTYRIEIMIDGKRISATRDTAKECERWASQKLLEHKAGQKLAEAGGVETITLAELLELYYKNVGQNKKSNKTIQTYTRTLTRDFSALCNMQIHEITPKYLTDWRNTRSQKVKDGSVLREMSFLSAVFSYAITELFLISENPFTQTSKPKQPASRHRRITDAEIEQILSSAEYEREQTPTETRHYVAWAFLFAIKTAMRRGEILRIQRSNIKNRHIYLPETKNGSERNVPLSDEAIEILSWIKHDDERLLPFSVNSFRLSFDRIMKKTDITGLTFHDTRHEAISRFVKEVGLPVEQLAKITGHKDIKTLIKVYYNPTTDELADALNRSIKS